jgi:hypothetical protein
VRIAECRPISKTISFVTIEKIWGWYKWKVLLEEWKEDYRLEHA